MSPSFFAVSPDERLVAGSFGVAGAEVEVHAGAGTLVGTLSVDLDRAARALDFSADGSSLLVTLRGLPGAPASLLVVSVPALRVTRTLALGASGAAGSFREPEARFLADQSIVAQSNGELWRAPPGATALQNIGPLPDGGRISVSPNKHFFVITTPGEVMLRESSRPASRARASSPRAPSERCARRRRP